MQNRIAKDTLREYVKENEVVFQAFGSLVGVANESEKENREELLSYFDDTLGVEIYQKGHRFIKDEFADLDRWATQNDVLFPLQNVGVLICVPKNKPLKTKFPNLNKK